MFTPLKIILGIVFGLSALPVPATAQPSVEPSNAAELASKKTAPFDLEGDARRKAKMSPGELAWELVLEQNLGGYYLPRYKASKLAGEETAWDFVKDVPALPRVLLIGDSISRGYTVDVRHALAGMANVHRAPANCGSTVVGLSKLPIWLGDGKWDVIHFNFGIHDRQTKDEVYAANLEQIIAQLKKTGAKLIWARTTPPASSSNQESFAPEQCERLNRTADAIIKKHGIPADDLYASVAQKLPELQKTNDVHFNDAGYSVLGNQAAAAIQSQLK